jgi:beta-mannosidase
MKRIAPAMIKQEISAGWMFREAASPDWHQATVPGCVHTDLLGNALIPDPFYRTNEAELQWIGEQDWVYQTIFPVSAELLERRRIDLVFKGLDTYARVYVNDSLMLCANNMFREWRADARSFLKQGKNKITIFFRNVFDETIPKYRNAPYDLQPLAKNHQGGRRAAMYSRKAQFHFGWDWGPRFVTCGVWKPVVIEAWDSFKIDSIQIIQQTVSKAEAVLISQLDIQSTRDQPVTITVTADSIKLGSFKRTLQCGSNTIALTGKITRPNLWWPNGCGEQYLYQYKAEVTDDDHSHDEFTASLGVRSLEIVQEKDSAGTSMSVLLNGVPVFMKGANYIPMDYFQNRVTHGQREYIVKSAADANMNMLRILGGGIYEDDGFYDMCDKYGILIVHEMLFAHAMAPVDDEFLNNVRHEVMENIKRIRNHPSIAMYCGNSENGTGWEQSGGNDKDTPEVQAVCEKTSRKLSFETIPQALREADSTRYYHPSSSIPGFGQRAGGECDIHSYPEPGSIEKFTEPCDRELNSKVMLSHQRCMGDEQKDRQGGDRLTRTYMDRYYRTPKDFSSFMFMSQVLQALGMQMAVEAHRRTKPSCMGSLSWQIDDCWPAASSSSIDYYGKWKALHYAARRFYAPILIAPTIVGDVVEFYIVSDLQEMMNGDLYVYTREFNGKITNVKSFPIAVRPNTSRIYLTMSKNELLATTNECSTVLVSRFNSRPGDVSENFTYFRFPKDLELHKPAYTITAKKVKQGYEISLTASTLAKNVCLSCTGTEGFFSDNYFDLVPHEVKKICFQTNEKIKDIEQKITAVSLVDMY